VITITTDVITDVISIVVASAYKYRHVAISSNT